MSAVDVRDTMEYAVGQIVRGHTARRELRQVALMLAQASADRSGVAVGVWSDSLGFIVTRTDDPVTRTDARLVTKARPRRGRG